MTAIQASSSKEGRSASGAQPSALDRAVPPDEDKALVPNVQFNAPQSLSGVFDQAFDLYKQKFKTLALIAALLYFPTQILLHGIYNTWLLPLFAHLQTPTGSAEPESWLTAFLGVVMIGWPEYGLPGLLSLMVLALMSGPLCVAVSDLYFGRAATVRESLRRARRNMPRLILGWTFAALICTGIGIGSLIVTFIIAILISALIAMTGVAATVSSGVSGVLMVLGIVASFLVCAGIVARFFLFTSPLIVLEGLPLSAVWNRNQQMVARLRFRHSWAAATALPAVVFGLQYLILLSAYSAVNALGLSPQWEFTIAAAFTALIVLFFQPYIAIFITLLYYDYRVRGEGLDLVLLAAFGLRPEPSGRRRSPSHEPADVQRAPAREASTE